MKNKKLTYEEHVKIGKKISAFNKQINELYCLINNTYGKNDVVSKTIRKLKNVLGIFRFAMDEQFYKDCPEKADSLESYYYDSSRDANKTEILTFRATKQVKDEIKRQAAKEGMTITQYLTIKHFQNLN